MSNHSFRVHPAIGFARVGNSSDYYLAPETAAGMPLENEEYVTGGIPINAQTDEPIKSSEIRDADGALVRTAARFKIFAYPESSKGQYPAPGGTEVKIGDTIDGKVVVDIVWQAHLANKKANQYFLENVDLGPYQLLIEGYENGNLPPVRNPQEGSNPDDIMRLRKLVIDPGPRALRASEAKTLKFDAADPASYFDEVSGEIHEIADYPKSFPRDSYAHMYDAWGPIDTLGELFTDDLGRLIVNGGYGRASSVRRGPDGETISDPDPDIDAQPYPLEQPVDNDGWFDDCSDGPIDATIMFEDGSKAAVHGAWLNVTDPSFAPQTQNAVSLWDDIYDTWVRKMGLDPEMYSNGEFNPDYEPAFPDHIKPFFVAAGTQRWNTNLPELAIQSHQAIEAIKASDTPGETVMAGLAFVRDPNLGAQSYQGAPFMPLSLGDNGRSFLSPSLTQYFLLSQWDNGCFRQEGLALTDGERMDRDVLINCLGGRFSPGIDMTFIVRQPGLYVDEWRESGCGPFRIRAAKIDYGNVSGDRPVLHSGWIPLHAEDGGVEPGDCSKFMSVPWHTDYNSCGTHETAPNPADNSQPSSSTLYWSWPAQRPVAVYTADDAANTNGALPAQRYSVRGPGTGSTDPGKQGRFQRYLDFVEHWPDVGTIIQATQIDDVPGSDEFDKRWYLEVQSRLENTNSRLEAWPINSQPEKD